MQSVFDNKLTISGDAEVSAKIEALDRKFQELFDSIVRAGAKGGDAFKKFGEKVNEGQAHNKEAGEGLEKLAQIFNSLPGAIGEVAEPLAGLIELFGKLTTGIGGVVTAGSVLVAGLERVADSASRTTIETRNAALAMGVTVEQLEGLKFAAASVGAAGEDMNRLFERFSVKIGQARSETEKAQKAWADSVPSLEKMADAHREAAAAADADALAIKRGQQTIEGNAHSLEGMVRGLKSSKDALGDLQRQYAAQVQQMGHGDPELARRIDEAKIRVENDEFQLAQARKKQEDELQAQRLRYLKQRHDAEVNAEKQTQEMKKSMGPEEDTDPNKRIIQEVAALGSAHADAATALGAFADKYKELTDQTKRAALAQSVFGRQWAEIAPLLNLGSKGIEKLQEDFEHLHITPTGAEEDMASRFYAATQKLMQVMEGAKNAFGNIIGQLFTPGFDALAHAIGEHMAGIREFADQVVQVLAPAFKTVGTVVGALAVTIEKATELFNEITGGKLSAGIAAIGVALLAIAPQWTAFTVGLIAIHAIIEELFGSKAADLFGPIMVGVLALIKVIYLVRDAFLALEIVASPFLAIAALITAIIAALVLLYGNIDSIGEVIGKVFGENAKESFLEFARGFREIAGQMIDWFKTTWVGRYIQYSYDAIKSMVDAFKAGAQAVSAIWDWLSREYKGSFLDKFITGTVDAIKYVWGWFDWLTQKIADVFKAFDKMVGIAAKDGGGAANDNSGSPSREVVSTGDGKARGGMISGASGHDAVPIRATAGEFVTRVAAVQHYGVGFMQRVNNLQIPKGFALGGLVAGLGGMISGPRGYAGGGMVAATAGTDGPLVSVELSHGGDTFHVLAPSSVADRLVTHSRREQMRSGGRKPDWFGGA